MGPSGLRGRGLSSAPLTAAVFECSTEEKEEREKSETVAVCSSKQPIKPKFQNPTIHTGP